MEKNYVIQKPSNGSMFVRLDENDNYMPMFCLHPNISDSINEAFKTDYENASIISILLQGAGVYAIPMNYHNLV